MAVVLVLLGGYGTAAAQTSTADQARAEAERIRGRQRIATMEAILSTAITNGAQMVIAQVRTAMPSDRPRLLSSPRVSGVKLDGYGMVFHVQVPVLQLPIMWDLRQQLVQQDTPQQTRQTAMLLQQLRTNVSTMPPGQDRARLEELVFNLEQQIEAGNVRVKEDDRPLRAASLVPGDPAKPAAAGAGGGRAGSGARQIDARAMEDPQETYTREVKVALIEAMLQNNQAFALSADEWLTIVAVDSVPNNPLMPADSIDSSTWVMRVKGSVLASYRSGTITLDEARKQVEVSEQ
jgi:hypothetical protein